MRGWNAARAIAVLRLADPGDARFVRACLLSKPLQHLMQAWATTTVQATLNLKEIRQLPLPWPPKADRDFIARTLGTLEAKIELNRRTSTTLESIARAIFQSWFVDFDPVYTRMAGGETGLPAHLVDLFPSAVEPSVLGPIPAGWHVGDCGAEFTITMGQSPPGSTYNETGHGVPFYQGCRDFGERLPRRRVFCTAPTRLGRSGDSLVSVRAPVGDVNVAAETCCVGRGLAAVRHRSGAAEYTLQVMRSLHPQLADFDSHGTVFGSIGGKDFRRLPVLVSPLELVHGFEQLVAPATELLATNVRESHVLARLRDALLPTLLSGNVQHEHGETDPIVGVGLPRDIKT
jgi:type I restriction enzyme S subunit